MIHSLLRERELSGLRGARQVRSQLLGHSGLVSRLYTECELNGHAGCVNRLAFNGDGSRLASVSDDCRCVLWDINNRRQAFVFDTRHQGNIFGVGFLPYSNDSVMVTGAMDHRVIVHHLSHVSTTGPLPVPRYLRHGFSSDDDDDDDDDDGGGLVEEELFLVESSSSREGSSDGEVHPASDSTENAANAGPQSEEGGDAPPTEESESESQSESQSERRRTGAEFIGPRLPRRRGPRGLPPSAHQQRSPERREVGESIEESGHTVYSVHTSRVKDVVVHAHEPTLFWSASEDGTVREFDLRVELDRTSPRCPNVLVDLRTLDDGEGRGIFDDGYGAKTVAVNPLRPEYICVGAGQGAVWLFDRRMISTGPRGRRPRVAVKFVPQPMVVAARQRTSRLTTSAVCTFVAWSPDGTEILANYNGDHVYLFGMDDENVQDVSPPLRGEKVKSQPTSSQATYVNELLEAANKHYAKSEWNEMVTLYTRALAINPRMPHVYSNRAAALLRRQWKGDDEAALHDANICLHLDPGRGKAHLRRAQALRSMGLFGEALREVKSSLVSFPSEAEVLLKLKNTLLADIHKRKERRERRRGANNAKSRKRQDEDQEMTLFGGEDDDGEGGGSGSTRRSSKDKGDKNGNDANGDINEDDDDNDDSNANDDDDDEDEDDDEFDLGGGSRSARWKGVSATDGSEDNDPRVPSRKSGKEEVDPEQSGDGDLDIPAGPPFVSSFYRKRFVGHRNTQTDIKEANFWGDSGNLIVTGSDDGRIYVYEKDTGLIVYHGEADSHSVNCVRVQPGTSTLVSSGIDQSIRVWTPAGVSRHQSKFDTGFMAENQAPLLAVEPDLSMMLLQMVLGRRLR